MCLPVPLPRHTRPAYMPCIVSAAAAAAGQAAALVLYTLVSLASTALVLSIAAPWGGNAWYLLCLLSPAAGVYYLQNATRTEEMKVKMITANDDSVTDIVMEGEAGAGWAGWDGLRCLAGPMRGQQRRAGGVTVATLELASVQPREGG